MVTPPGLGWSRSRVMLLQLEHISPSGLWQRTSDSLLLHGQFLFMNPSVEQDVSEPSESCSTYEQNDS